MYVHQQINGTFPDIFERLSDLVDFLEYPNSGSITTVTKDDAKLISEEIGACPQDFDAFLEEDGVTTKALKIVEHTKCEASPWKRLRHPRHIAQDVDVMRVAAQLAPSEDVPTEKLIAKAKREPIGIWCHVTGKGKIMFYSPSGHHCIGLKHMKQYPVDSTLNVWFKTHACEGVKACGAGWCGGLQHAPVWINIHEEDPPVLTPELRRTGCAGFCHRARKGTAT